MWLIELSTEDVCGTMGLKSIDLLPLVPQKLSVESSINDDVYQKSMFSVQVHAQRHVTTLWNYLDFWL